MTHVSQIFRSKTYSVLNKFEQMKGKTVVGVFKLKSETNHTVIVFVNEATILITDNGSVVRETDIMDYELKELEELTGITEDQLF